MPVLCHESSIWRMDWRTGKLGQPWFVYTEGEVASLAIEVEECWWWCLRDNSVVANFDFDLAGFPIERKVVNLMSQFGREGRVLKCHIAQL
jgi:hypothetical protein